MKTEPNEPMNPVTYDAGDVTRGLTKREYFAAMALASGSTAKDCVLKADALIEALNKQLNPGSN